MKGAGIAKFLKRKVCKQTMVYWPPLERNEMGEMTYDAPYEVPCRWDIGLNLISAYNGAPVAILNARDVECTGTILHPLEYRLQEEGYVWQGRLADLTPDEIINPKLIGSTDLGTRRMATEVLKVETTPFLGAVGLDERELMKVVYI